MRIKLIIGLILLSLVLVGCSTLPEPYFYHGDGEVGSEVIEDCNSSECIYSFEGHYATEEEVSTGYNTGKGISVGGKE